MYTCAANGAPDAMLLREGTSFAAPQVVSAFNLLLPLSTPNTNQAGPSQAGLAAYMISYPWPSPAENPLIFTAPYKLGTVGRRIKTMIADTYAYRKWRTTPRHETPG